MEKMIIERTKQGYPAYWEGGGGHRNTGDATIISGKDGQPKKAIYIRTRGSLANANHALVILEVGDYIIEANHHREDFNIYIYKILQFKTEKFVEEKDRFVLKEKISEEEFVERYKQTYNEYIKGKSSEINGLTRYYELPSGDYCRKDSWDYIKEIEIYEKKTEQKQKEEDVAIVELVYEFSSGEWDAELPAFLEAAVQAAVEKATCYHCREPHFITV
jgi:hypothetical protein